MSPDRAIESALSKLLVTVLEQLADSLEWHDDVAGRFLDPWIDLRLRETDAPVDGDRHAFSHLEQPLRTKAIAGQRDLGALQAMVAGERLREPGQRCRRGTGHLRSTNLRKGVV